MKLFDDYLDAKKQVFEYFGYAEDWAVIPLDDSREFYWYLDGEGPGTLCYAKTETELKNQNGDYYESEIYTQRFLPKWVYRGADYTLVCVDTHVDGNKFLTVLSNNLERPR